MTDSKVTEKHPCDMGVDPQEIVDEPNAAMSDGECENISDPPEGFLCSLCGWGDFAEPSHLLTTAKYTGRVEGGPNFCPNCGKAVKR